jgi:hypothetical protein
MKRSYHLPLIKLLPPRLNKFKTTVELRSRLDMVKTTDADYHQLWSNRITKIENELFDLSRAVKLSTISIEESLFICLGFSASILEHHPFQNFSLDDYDGVGLIENALLSREEYLLIRREFPAEISSKKFLRWATKHNYLEQVEIKWRNTKDSPYGEEFAMKLYQLLSREGLITGSFEQLWEWHEHSSWASLHFLALELIRSNLVDVKQPFKSIEKYIDSYSPTSLRKHYEYALDITKATDDGKVWNAENDRIGSVITKLEKDKEKED